VGAIITTKSGEVVATGANDVPCSKGGLYSEDDGENDHRDHKRGYDSNERIRNNIAVEIMKKLTDITDREKLLKEGREKLKDTGLFEITEYGRSVHAEMEALVSCARVGIPIRDGTLYTTTFPCHNCTKHLVAAGLSRIVFVEPYPKSKATELHSDSIVIVHEAENEEKNNRVKFEPFVGVGPRKFMDLFSMTLSSGNTKTRKNGEKKVEWSPANSCIRIPLMPLTYIDKETYHYAEIAKLVDQLEGDDDGSKKR
jgi:deoxycytidylate deaminase